MTEHRSRRQTGRILAALLGPAATGVFAGTVGWAVTHDPTIATTSVEESPTSDLTTVAPTPDPQFERMQQQLSDTRARLNALQSAVAGLKGTIDVSPTPGRDPQDATPGTTATPTPLRTTTARPPARQPAATATRSPAPTRKATSPPPTHTKTGASGGG